MKILVIGSGLMGPAAAYNAMIDPAVTSVMITDRSPEQLDRCAAVLREKPGAENLAFRQLDIGDLPTAVSLMTGFDAAVSALPRPANIDAMKAALRAGIPLVDLAQSYPAHLAPLADETIPDNALIVLGCGVEPGLTEIVARHLADGMDEVHEVHIKCGGIPAEPAPPLGYKIVFGGKQMPLHESDSEIVRNGAIEMVPRYSGVEPVVFPGVGQCEAWHEGFKPWILEIASLQNIRYGTQKTVRWPGYAEKVTVLKDLGLLSPEPLRVDGVRVVPKHLVDAVLLPRVTMDEGEHDITCFRVELLGKKDGKTCQLMAEMVDYSDEQTGFTSMARTTAFTGAIVARMIAAGKLNSGVKRIVTPERVIVGPAFAHLMQELQAMNVNIAFSTEELALQ